MELSKPSSPVPPVSGYGTPPSPTPGKQPLAERVKHYFRHHWKEFLLAVAVGVAASVMIYALTLQLIFAQRSVLNVKGSDKIYSPLSGLETTQELAARPVTGVMIENSPDARPQSSVSQAGVVFEAVAEGGITRYLTLFQETRPKVLGPVRSLRIYYLDWAMGYQAAVAHVGGSAEALDFVRKRGARDLDQFQHANLTYRVGDRAAPHNAYTSFDRLDEVSSQLRYKSSSFTPYLRKKDAPAQSPTHANIAVNYSGPLYAIEFRYEKANNRYLRHLAGSPDIDRTSGKQIAAKNVVMINMPTSYNGSYAVMPTISSGKGTLYLDGVAVPIKWKKSAPTNMIELTDQAGQQVRLNRGLTWFAINPS